MEESNYLMLTVVLKETELKQEDLDELKSDLSTSMDKYLDKLEEIESEYTDENLTELNNSVDSALQ